MDDTLHLHLTHEELKDLLRRRFARAGLEPPIFDAIDEIALLIRRHGFAAFLEDLELLIRRRTLETQLTWPVSTSHIRNVPSGS
jgi:hypothetical protein